jgi:hypothetical protein
MAPRTHTDRTINSFCVKRLFVACTQSKNYVAGLFDIKLSHLHLLSYHLIVNQAPSCAHIALQFY